MNNLDLPGSTSCRGVAPVSPSSKLTLSFLLAAGLCFALAASPVAQGQIAPLVTSNIGIATASFPVTLTFNTSAILGSISVVTQGAPLLDFSLSGTAMGTTPCVVTTSHPSGDTCTVGVVFKPKVAGYRYGAVVLKDGSGNVIATTFLVGKGAGHQTTFLPGTETTLSANSLSPGAPAVDASGNLYIADTGYSRVLKETLSGGIYTESTVPTGSLNSPDSVAVDGAGNLYIADSGNNRILKETLTGAGYVETILPGSTLNYPIAAVVDASGNVYIADFLNHRVVKESFLSGNYNETVVQTTGLNYPTDVAVDGTGILYIADGGNGRVLKMTPSGSTYTESLIPKTATLNYPTAVAVDGNGNVYIADTNSIYRETPGPGKTYIETKLPTSILGYPWGIAVDGSGNLYVADTNNNKMLKEDFGDPPSLSFASTTLNTPSPDSPRTVTVSNYGNSILHIATIAFPADFTEITTPPTGGCLTLLSGTGNLASNASCTLTLTFKPLTALNGPPSALLSESVVVTSNTLNVTGTAQSIAASGTETLQ